MRGIVAVLALLIGVWYLRDRQRRSRLQEGLRGVLPTKRDQPASDMGSSVSEMVAKAQATINEVQEHLPETARRVADAAAGAGHTLVQKVQERANVMSQGAPGATATQGGAGATAGGAQQAAQPAADRTQASGEPSEDGTGQSPAAAAAPPRARGEGSGSATSAEEAAQPAPARGETAGATPASEQPVGYIGNVNSRVYHLATSPNLPAEENRITFATEEEALAAGFRPAEGEDLEGEAEGAR